MVTDRAWTREVHDKARLLHDQIAALSVKAAEAADGEALQKILCAPYYAMLDRLFTEELPWARAMDDSDIVVRMRGPAADETAPRVKLIADAFDQVRKQVQNIAKAIAGVTTAKALPDDLDLGLSGFARGSVVMGLRVRANAPDAAPGTLGENDPLLEATRAAVKQLGEVTRYVDEDGIDERFAARFDDPGVRDAVLTAAVHLAPTGRTGIDQVELTAPGSTGPAGNPLTAASRTVLRRAIERPVKRIDRGRYVGVVRELDLDLMRFELRRMPGVVSLRCVYPELGEERARTLLNAVIEVAGWVEYDGKGQPRLLQVESLDILQQPPEQQQLIPLE